VVLHYTNRQNCSENNRVRFSGKGLATIQAAWIQAEEKENNAEQNSPRAHRLWQLPN